MMKRSLIKVLITCGPTWVPIDDVRVISNISTGTLGQMLAQDFARAGGKVTLIEGPVQRPLESKTIKILKFKLYDELFALLKKQLTDHFDVIIHLAAVSDYQLKKTFRSKLSSHLTRLDLKLVPTKKIIEQLKRIAPKSFLVGFKLEPKISEGNIKRYTKNLFEKAQCNLAVVNSISGNQYLAYIVDTKGNILAKASKKEGLSKLLIKAIKENL
ncbi:MAG: hypothetical protein HQL24_01640 [Candidatus Omnitrophica bacterium]|nr:hypothetical protein [Candidatus Omnitrophota bacterium]